MREFLRTMRPVLLTLAAVVIVVVVEMQRLAGPERRWMLSSNGLVLVPRFDSTRFFLDSMFVVELGAHEEAALPIRVTGFYSGSMVPVAERELVAAIRASVAARRGAKVVAQRFVPLEMEQAPAVTLHYDFWEGGGVRTDVIVTCPGVARAAAPGAVFASAGVSMRETVSSARGRISERAMFESAVTRDLRTAAEARCRPGGEGEAVRTAKGAAAVEARVMSPAELRAAQATARVVARAAVGTVQEIRVRPDTVRLAVGEALSLDRALRLTVIRDDGSVVERVTPLFAVEDRAIARLSPDRVTGVAPGTTRLTIRAAIGTAGTSPQGQVVVKVAP